MKRPTMRSTSLRALVVLAALPLVACDTMLARDAARLEQTDSTTIATRYPVGAILERTAIDVSGYTGTGPQSTTAYFNATRFVRTYAQDGRGPLHVLTPARGGHRDATMVRRVIQANGLSSGQVRMRTRSDGLSVVTLAYDRMAAVGPEDCYDLSALSERRPLPESGTAFGCATQKNLAKMIADPSHLVVAAPEPDRGSDRRAAIHRDYKETVRKVDSAKQ